MITRTTKGEPFFYYFSGLLLITVVVAFGMNILLDRYHLNSSMALVGIHGVSMLLWYIIFFWQSYHVRINSIKVHRQLGLMTIVLAVAIIISGILIAISNYKGEGKALVLFGNFSGMFTFGVLYAFAIKYRHRSDVPRLGKPGGVAIQELMRVRWAEGFLRKNCSSPKSYSTTMNCG